jgi:protein-S-isoprenylcysteine O-methyltransferase Ste14
MHGSHPLLRLLSRTPVRTFVLMPIAVAAVELAWRGGTLAVEPAGLVLLAWGYAQYRLAGRYRRSKGGGGPGIEVPPVRLVTSGIYRFTRNPMYLGHLIFIAGLAVTFRSWFALALLAVVAVWFDRRVRADEARMRERFGEEYAAYVKRTWRWAPGVG